MDQPAFAATPLSGSGTPVETLANDALLAPAAVTENSVLRRLIRDEIRTSGPLTFRRFMELALYHPREGYYRRRPLTGRTGDYLTSPEVHPLFGAVLRRQLHEMWQVLDRPTKFVVAEMGAGSGALARAFLAAGTDDDFAQALRYAIAEPSPQLRATQAATLGSLAEHVRWHDGLATLERIRHGCFLSNELPDSFPVHRVINTGGALREIFVDETGGGLSESHGEPSTPELGRYFAHLGLLPGNGCVAEVNLDALGWMTEVAGLMEAGFVLTLDYGYPAARLYAPWRKQGTLLCYAGHTVGTDPYCRVGRQDITAHVDFTSLARAGEAAGLSTVGCTTQQHLLSSLGITRALAGGPAAAGGLEEYLSRRRAVEDLLNPEGLGRIRVLVQSRGAVGARLRAFADEQGEPL